MNCRLWPGCIADETGDGSPERRPLSGRSARVLPNICWSN